MSLGMIFALDAKIGMLDQEKSSRIFPEYEGGSTVGHVCLHFLTFTCFYFKIFLKGSESTHMFETNYDRVDAESWFKLRGRKMAVGQCHHFSGFMTSYWLTSSLTSKGHSCTPRVESSQI